MISLSKIFRKYTGVLRQLKPLYVINNWLNREQLQHNRELYAKYGLQKSIYSSIGSSDFPQHHVDIPWLDRPDARQTLENHPDFGKFSQEMQREFVRFVEDGYLILKGFFSEERVEKLNADVDRLLKERSIDFNYTGRKIMESYKVSPEANDFFRDQELLNIMAFLMGKPVIPFHTINFIQGSEQRPHSDFIHMSTEPQGYLIAAWVALEDIEPEQGALIYYPGSHRLPYLTTQDYPSGNTALTIGANSNTHFEDKIEALIQEQNLKPEFFRAKKGDVLIWHANLIHAGSPITRKGATRKSMVAHYFCEGVICYHEMSQRPAFLERR